MKRLLAGLPLLFFTAANLLAQNSSPSPEESATATPIQFDEKAAQEAAKGILGGLMAFGALGCVFFIVWVGIWLWIAIWVMKDAKRRQSPNATLVTVLAWIPATTVIGLIVHLVTRPKTIPGAPNP